MNQKSFLSRLRRYEKKYSRQFYRYLQEINFAISKWMGENDSFDVNADDFIDTPKLEKIYKKLYLEVGGNEGKLQAEAFDDPVNMQLFVRELNELLTVDVANRIVEVDYTTKKRIAHLIEKGLRDGLGAKEVARTIEKDTGFSRNRSIAIARTEMTTSANYGKLIAAKNSRFPKLKKWLPAEDDRTRLSHLEMEHVPYIEIDQNFIVGEDLEEAQYPGDTSLSSGECINCRCTLIFKNK